MKLIFKFATTIDGLAVRVISSHFITFFHLAFITFWLVAQLDLAVLALVLSFEGVFIWTVVLKSTERIRQGQENKSRFENKRLREFLENDVKVTEQDLRMTREVYAKVQDVEYKSEEMREQLENLVKAVGLTLDRKD